MGMGDWNAKSRDDAEALLNAITFSFIIALVTVKYVLNLSRPATVKLQKEDMDLLSAEQEILALKHSLDSFQQNIEENHGHLYDEAVQLAAKAIIEPSHPRTCQCQTLRANNPATTTKDYYRVNLTRPFLDHSLTQLNSRFRGEAL